jgi:hypothetical protein
MIIATPHFCGQYGITLLKASRERVTQTEEFTSRLGFAGFILGQVRQGFLVIGKLAHLASLILHHLGIIVGSQKDTASFTSCFDGAAALPMP